MRSHNVTSNRDSEQQTACRRSQLGIPCAHAATVHAQITPEFFFQEADYSSNLLINNNIFDSYFGGIELAFISDSNLLPGQFQNHANINITNNIIRVGTASDGPFPPFFGCTPGASDVACNLYIVCWSEAPKHRAMRVWYCGSCMHAEQLG